MMAKSTVLLIFLSLNATQVVTFSARPPLAVGAKILSRPAVYATLAEQPSATNTARVNAPELVRDLVVDKKCFTTESGARAFADACAENVIFDDCFESKPFVGREEVTKYLMHKVASRRGKGGLRMDRITDGKIACGFAWTWTCDDMEGLRGTTFVELNDKNGAIQYVREIAEPISKPGDSMTELLHVISGEREPKPPADYQKQTPTVASEIGRYLFCDVQWSDIDECLRFIDESIFCRDFNYANPVHGKEAVGEFAKGFGNIPGINFRGQRFDDGVLSTCYVWEVDLKGAPEPVKGISFQELNPQTKQIANMRDLSAPTVVPPLLGQLARFLRPGLGVFQGVKLGSRPGGK